MRERFTVLEQNRYAKGTDNSRRAAEWKCIRQVLQTLITIESLDIDRPKFDVHITKPIFKALPIDPSMKKTLSK